MRALPRPTLLPLLLLAAVAAAQEAPPRPAPTPQERRATAEDLFARHDRNRDLRLAGVEIPDAGWLERFDRDGDDVIAKREMLHVVDRGPGFDRLFVLRDPRARARNARGQFDQDKDGLVSREEYPGDPRAFEKADRDRDGKLEWKELVRMAGQELEDIRRRTKSPGKYEFFELFDLNYDRLITLAEYDGPARSFRQVDENGDGVVEYYEIYPELRPDRMARARPEPEDLTVIATLDADGDGRVSRAEWKGSAAAWKRVDRNGDGWLTTADAR